MKSQSVHRPPRPTATSGQTLQILTTGSPGRRQVESFIHRVYARAYGADLQHFMPRLFALRNEHGRLLAALGLRDAGRQPLYLEHYLPRPVQSVLADVTGDAVARDDIVELGNLASMHRGGLRNLILALTAYLTASDTQWVVFTAVPAVRAAFDALGLPLHQIGIADAGRLPSGAGQWGSYYRSGPVVLAGRVADGFQRLQAAVQQESLLQAGQTLWHCARRRGHLDASRRVAQRIRLHGDAA